MRTTRRQMIRSLAGGGLLLPGLLSELLRAEGNFSAPDGPLSPKMPHFTARAKRVIFLFMTGAVSHVDTFDPKPFLSEHHNQPYKKNRVYKGADWTFRRYGESGIEVSDLFPHIGSVIDDICVVRSMQNINGDHFGATIGIHTGSATFNRPSIGSWVSYGLGTENRNLPSFMVISPGLPYAGGQVWGSDFLPVLHQGTRIIPGDEPIANMRRRSASAALQETELDPQSRANASISGDTAISPPRPSAATSLGQATDPPHLARMIICPMRYKMRPPQRAVAGTIDSTSSVWARVFFTPRLKKIAPTIIGKWA